MTKFWISTLLLISSTQGAYGQSPVPPGAWRAPQHPFMAPNGKSNLHNDAYMTDTYSQSGPTVANTQTLMANLGGECASVTFDAQGRILTVCINGISGARALKLVDPATLTEIASYTLPQAPVNGFGGGGYFYLNEQSQVIVPCVDNTLRLIGVTQNTFTEIDRVDISEIPNLTQVTSIIPDWSGTYWFVTKEGIVGTLTQDRRINYLDLSNQVGGSTEKEGITNSLSVDENGGVYIVSTHALYRFYTDATGVPKISWREQYNRGTRVKPGQTSQGSGTTPTVIGHEYVAITDNADPQMNVLLYKRQPNVTGNRLVCSVPVFAANASSTENSLVAYNNSIFVENNYGYTGPASTILSKITEPGISRIDITSTGCKIIWTAAERAPSVVAKFSDAAKLLYTYVKQTDGWYFVGINYGNGTVKFRTKVGGNLNYNNHYAPITLGPDGSAYVGVINGLLKIKR